MRMPQAQAHTHTHQLNQTHNQNACLGTTRFTRPTPPISPPNMAAESSPSEPGARPDDDQPQAADGDVPGQDLDFVTLGMFIIGMYVFVSPGLALSHILHLCFGLIASLSLLAVVRPLLDLSRPLARLPPLLLVMPLMPALALPKSGLTLSQPPCPYVLMPSSSPSSSPSSVWHLLPSATSRCCTPC